MRLLAMATVAVLCLVVAPGAAQAASKPCPSERVKVIASGHAAVAYESGEGDF